MALDSLSVAAGNTSYLAVWRGLEPAPRMMGALISTTGVASTAFPISDSSGAPLESPVQHATVACDGANFLAVWADNRTGGAGIRGAFVTSQGGVVGAADFLIAPVSRTNDLAPQVVFTGADYLVAWQDAAPASVPAAQIRYARVATAGTVSAPAALPWAEGRSHALEFLVAGQAPEALVVFQDAGVTPNETRAVRVAADNGVVGPAEGVMLFKQDFSVAGFGAPIGAAYENGEYVILSSYSAQIDSSVFKTRLQADGSVIRPSAPFAEVGQGTTGLAEDAFPRTFYNGAGEFLFVRNDKVSESAYHLLTKRVTSDGTDRDPNLPFIDSASQGVLNGAVAAALGSQYLVAWMDGRRGAQPARQLNVFGLLLDGTKPGDETTPIVKAVARVSPVFGSAPLQVYFWLGGSTGILDSLRWDFGDGESSTSGSGSHTYTTQGYYLAVLSLFRAGFAVRDFARIAVDMNELGGGGGPPQAVGGSLGPVSNGVNTDLITNSLTVALNHQKTGADSLRFVGYCDPSVLPVSSAGQSGALTIGDKTYVFSTGSTGTYYSAAGVTPAYRFGVNRYNGLFVLTVTADDLRALFASLGADNETVAKPGKDVMVPFVFEYAGLKLDSYVAAKYTATAGKAGKVNYYLGSSGYSGSGYFRVFGAAAKESVLKGSADKQKVHAFTVTGNWGFGGNVKLAQADAGAWRVTLGNYAEDLPVGSLVESSGVYTYNGGKAKTGLTGLYYNTRNGAFVLGWRNVAAEGENPSGMALASSQFWRADLALSVDLDLQGGTKFQGSGYVRFGRQKLNAKKWKLR